MNLGPIKILLLSGLVSTLVIGSAFYLRIPGFEPNRIPYGVQEKDIQFEGHSFDAIVPVSSSSPTTIRVPIFIYHSVLPDSAKETLMQKAFTVTPELFDEQMKYLHDNGYTAITLHDLAKDIAAGTTSPIARPVVLTFDDGWQNEYTYGFPILKKYRMQATFFIYPNPISKDSRFMTWEQVKEMDAAGMDIGDHSMTHPLMSKLNEQQLHREVVDSKAVLEAKLGHPVTEFASPFGYMNPHIEEVLKAAGYETARTVNNGAHHSSEDRFHLTGFLVHRTMQDFEWALRYAP